MRSSESSWRLRLWVQLRRGDGAACIALLGSGQSWELPMRSLLRDVLLGGLLVGLLAVPFCPRADAADAAVWRPSLRVHQLPFPRGERAQAIWNERSCWSECGSHCAWGMSDCLAHDAQGLCLKRADRCDRYCQRECRTSGGPLLGFVD